MFQERVFQNVSREIEWCFKRVFSGFQEYLQEVQREYQGSFKGVSGVLQDSYLEDWSWSCLKISFK